MDEPQLTQLLRAAADGDEAAAERFCDVVYEELERVAAGQLYNHYGAKGGQLTLEPRVLVNESLMKLLQNPMAFDNRAHFFSFISRVMMRVMLDYQRRKSAGKRGGGQVRVTLSGLGESHPSVQLSRLEECMDELDRLDQRKGKVLRLRAMWGLEVDEVAEILAVSPRTVERDWRFARTWLAARLES